MEEAVLGQRVAKSPKEAIIEQIRYADTLSVTWD